MRATLRLARDLIPGDRRTAENAAFRDAGRRLAGPRDERVLLETIDAVRERYAAELPANGFEPFRDALVDRSRRTEQELRDSATPAEVADELGAARTRIAAWRLNGHQEGALRSGLERVYRRGRREYRRAVSEPTSENLHEWRKRVKDLWYSAQVLRPGAPKRLRKVATNAHRLADLLGEDHDLAVLEGEARRQPGCFGDPSELQGLSGLIERRRGQLQRRAFKRGARLYRAKPRRFAARLVPRDAFA